MPTATNIVDCYTDDNWFGDVDAGEMLLKIRKYCGIDLSWMSEDGGTSRAF